MKSLLWELVEYGGRNYELSAERAVEFRMIRAVVGAGDIFYIASGIFVSQCEAVTDVGACGMGTFALNEWGNWTRMLVII